MFWRNFQLFFLEAADAVRARGTSGSGRTDGPESYSNLRTQKILCNFHVPLCISITSKMTKEKQQYILSRMRNR
jgi:hypothetical protein